MTFNILLLFLSAFIPALAVLFLPGLDAKKFRGLLTFSGAYLFAITVIHLIPELLHESHDLRLSGIFILTGFFFQMVLEYFTSGVEHGHIHVHVHESEKLHLPYSLLISICIHAFLEGTLLSHPSDFHTHDDTQTLLFGLMLHKIPEAIALASVLAAIVKKSRLTIFLLFVFSAASPVGVILTHAIFTEDMIAGSIFNYLFAVVAGNFLYISTTIFFETSPNHTFKANKLLMAVLGAGAAVVAEFVIRP